MKPNMLDLSAIHPRRGDKYSPNLHKFMALRSHTLFGRYGRIYRDQDDVLWLGFIHDGDFIGARLVAVLCNGAKEQTGCYSPSRLGLNEVADFWQRYQADGRCAIDTAHTMHFIGDESRWEGDEEHRTCKWCGKASQRRERWQELVDRNRWVADQLKQ